MSSLPGVIHSGELAEASFMFVDTTGHDVLEPLMEQYVGWWVSWNLERVDLI